MSARVATPPPGLSTSARVATPPDATLIARDWRASGSHPPEVWLAALRPLVEPNRSADRARGALPWIGALAAAVAAGAFLVGGRGIALGIACVVVALAAFGGRIALRRPTVPPLLADFVLPLLAILREEMRRGEPVTLAFDLGGAVRSEKRRNERTWRVGGADHCERWYYDPWLTGSARLRDDARLSWQLTDVVRERERKRRNPRGKLKTKTKHKIKQHLIVRLGLPRERYAVTPAAPSAPPAARRPAHPRVASARARVTARTGARRDVIVARRTVATRDLSARPSITAFLESVEQAYRRATPTQGRDNGR